MKPSTWLLCSLICITTNLLLVVVKADKPLYIGGIFPMTGSWAGGKGCRPAVDMALEDVNNHPDILPGYTLNMVANDSMVSRQTSYFKYVHTIIYSSF